MNDKQRQLKDWCITLHNPNCALDFIELHKQFKYMVYQGELSEKGSYHFQIYLEFKRSVKFGGVVKLFRDTSDDGEETAHIESRRGTREEARAYCMKTDTKVDGPWELGNWNPGGITNSYILLKQSILEGKNIKDIFLEQPGQAIRHRNNIQYFINMFAPPRNFKTFVTVIIGPPDCGKSRYVSELEGTERWYWKPTGNEWWDCYDGTSNVVIDDYKSWLEYWTLLRIMDRYGCLSPVKGTFINFAPKAMFITSTQHIRNWNPSARDRDFQEINRRVDKYLIWSGTNFTEMDNVTYRSLFEFEPL